MSLSSRGYSTAEIKEITSKYKDMGKSKKDKKREERKKEEKKYEGRRGDDIKDPKNFDEYQDAYALREYGAGSGKKPKASRFSGLDVRKMFDAGTDRFGLSKADAAREVLDYADDMKGKTRMGGATQDALDKLRGYLQKEETEEPKTYGNTDRPEQVVEDQERFEETRLDKPENQMPRLEDAYVAPTEDAYTAAFNKGVDANMAAIRGGDDLNEWYQTKFVPHLEADANATNSEIGDDSRYFLKNFAFEPPKLGDIKDLFDRYKGEIEDLD